MGHKMNNGRFCCFATLALVLSLNEAHADYRSVDPLVKDFNQVSAQITRGELQAAEAGLAALRQRTGDNDTRIGQYQRELANAYLQQSQRQRQAGDAAAAEASLARGEPHLSAASPALRQAYQASRSGSANPTAAAAPATATAAPDESAESRRAEVERRLREAEAALAAQEAERARARQLAAEQAAAEREARLRQAAMVAAAPAEQPAAAPQPAPEPQAATAAVPRAQLIDPQASRSSIPMPMLDADDRDSLRELLDQVAADVVAFNCAVTFEVREAKDYPFVAALLIARIKKLDPDFSPRLSQVLRPDQPPRLLLSPQRRS